MKTATSLRRIVLTLTTGAAGAVFALGGVATAATTQSYQISPPTANYASDPSGTVKGTIKVTNLTDTPLSIKIGKQNFVAKGEEGEVELVDEANPLYSLSPWFTYDATQLDIAARATKELHYTIAVPVNAEPGGRYGSITFNTIPPALAPGQSGASVQQTLASLAFLRINGEAKEELSILSFGAEKSFYEYGPVKFLTRVKNSGNVHEKPTGTITIKNMFGIKVGSFALSEHFVIPDAVRRLHNEWPNDGKKHFIFGKYTATLDAKYGDGKTLTASATFTVIPWKQVAIGLAILLVLIVFFWKTRKRWARAIRILSGKE